LIQGIGIDIIEIERIKKAKERWNNKFLKRIFRNEEIKYCNSSKLKYQHFAARFAAKEALIKALGETLNWKDIEVIKNERKSPKIKLHGKAKKIMTEKGIKKILLSLSHSKEYAVAQVITQV
jgi:holo-[acyl-carrier protein] synthase